MEAKFACLEALNFPPFKSNADPRYFCGFRFSGQLAKDEMMLYIPKNQIHIK
jgi:hypothetical protein